MKGTSNMDRETWSKNLKAFVAATGTSLKLAVSLSLAALEHFAKHGDTIYLNEFMEAMPENYIRRSAFATWAGAHAPLGMVNGKFVKDKAKAEVIDWDNEDGETKARLLKAAAEKTFWDFVPDKKPVIVTSDDVVTNLFSMINRLRNTKTHDPDPEALATLSMIEGFAINLKAERERRAAIRKVQPAVDNDNKEAVA